MPVEVPVKTIAKAAGRGWNCAPPLPESPWATTAGLLRAALVFLLLASLLAPLDLRVARYCIQQGLPGEFQRVLIWSEAFAHGLGVALIALAVIALDPLRRKFWPRILLSAYAAGVAANVIKLSVGRYRPAYFLEHAELAADYPLTAFAGWLPWATHADYLSLGRAVQSFPSGHTATATAFSIALAAVYPRGRWIFAGLAVLAAAQRIDAGAHYPSDVLAGAAVGIFTAAILARVPGGPAEHPPLQASNRSDSESLSTVA